MIHLSILIPTIPPRLSSDYSELLVALTSQVGNRKDIEIISLCDNFIWSVGEKRNKLLSIASGAFICFLDDDDMVSGDYVDELVSAIMENPEAQLISFNVKMWAQRLVEYDTLQEKIPDGYIHMNTDAAHIYAWRRSFIKDTKFEKVSFGEDNKWAHALLEKKPNTYHIDKFIYEYKFDPFNSETRNEAPS